MVWIAGIGGLLAGGAIIWVGKEKLQSFWTDANTIAASLRAKADAIASAAKR